MSRLGFFGVAGGARRGPRRLRGSAVSGQGPARFGGGPAIRFSEPWAQLPQNFSAEGRRSGALFVLLNNASRASSPFRVLSDKGAEVTGGRERCSWAVLPVLVLLAGRPEVEPSGDVCAPYSRGASTDSGRGRGRRTMGAGPDVRGFFPSAPPGRDRFFTRGRHSYHLSYDGQLVFGGFSLRGAAVGRRPGFGRQYYRRALPGVAEWLASQYGKQKAGTDAPSGVTSVFHAEPNKGIHADVPYMQPARAGSSNKGVRAFVGDSDQGRGRRTDSPHPRSVAGRVNPALFERLQSRSGLWGAGRRTRRAAPHGLTRLKVAFACPLLACVALNLEIHHGAAYGRARGPRTPTTAATERFPGIPRPSSSPYAQLPRSSRGLERGSTGETPRKLLKKRPPQMPGRPTGVCAAPSPRGVQGIYSAGTKKPQRSASTSLASRRLAPS